MLVSKCEVTQNHYFSWENQANSHYLKLSHFFQNKKKLQKSVTIWVPFLDYNKIGLG